MKVRVPLLSLCDTSNVREGLLSILGAGITRLDRDGQYPAKLEAVIVCSVEVSQLDQPEPIELVLAITHEDGEPTGLENAVLNFTPDDEGPAPQVPLLAIPVHLDTEQLVISRPGVYTVSISRDEQVLNLVSFFAI